MLSQKASAKVRKIVQRFKSSRVQGEVYTLTLRFFNQKSNGNVNGNDNDTPLRATIRCATIRTYGATKTKTGTGTGTNYFNDNQEPPSSARLSTYGAQELGQHLNQRSV